MTGYDHFPHLPLAIQIYLPNKLDTEFLLSGPCIR